jgi:hypothetical protein
MRLFMPMKKYNMNKYKAEVNKIMKQTNRKGEDIEKFLLDSIVQSIIETDLQPIKNRPVAGSCIAMAGSLNDERFIPVLESTIEEYKNHQDSAEITIDCIYALAKLGVKKYMDYILQNRSNIDFYYLGTRESFLKCLDNNNFAWNRNKKYYLKSANK